MPGSDTGVDQQPPTTRVDTYLTRKAQAAWPRAIVYCGGGGPPAEGLDGRPFWLTRPGEPDVALGAGGFGDARAALKALTDATRRG